MQTSVVDIAERIYWFATYSQFWTALFHRVLLFTRCFRAFFLSTAAACNNIFHWCSAAGKPPSLRHHPVPGRGPSLRVTFLASPHSRFWNRLPCGRHEIEPGNSTRSTRTSLSIGRRANSSCTSLKLGQTAVRGYLYPVVNWFWSCRIASNSFFPRNL
jgi:hypothetical protein